MARISGINIPLNKRVEVGLTYIYGIGRPMANRLLAEAGIDRDTYVRDLTDDEVTKLRDLIDSDLTVEGDLRRERSQNIKRLVEIQCYRGRRHQRGLPAELLDLRRDRPERARRVRPLRQGAYPVAQVDRARLLQHFY